MKKILQIIFAVILITTIFSCTKKVQDAYPNPNTVDPPSGNKFAGYFTNMLYQWKFYVKDYGEYWWDGDLGVGMYAQTQIRYVTPRYTWYSDYDDLENGEGGNGFQGAASGVQSQYGACYSRMRDWGTMNLEMEGLTDEQKNDVNIFYQLGTVFKDVWCARLVDLFNSIPYTDAFQGKANVFFPKFDDPKQTYLSILQDLKTISGSLQSDYDKMSPSAQALFKNQDFVFNGDVSKWIKYINSERLKLAIRISGVAETEAKAAISDAITNLPDFDCQFSSHTTEVGGAGGYWTRGVYERQFTHFVPNVIMKRMNLGNLTYEPGTDDPRLPVIAMPTKFADYRGCSMNADTNQVYYTAPYNETYYAYADNLDASLSSNGGNSRSMYNIATYAMNGPNFPVKMMTLSEMDLFLAEAELKGLANTGKTAGEHIRDAITHSCNYWYAINGANAAWRSDVPVVHPAKSDANITTYAAAVKTLFESQATLEDKMEILMQQKYIHLNTSDSYELWTELRRTRHPLLEPLLFKGVTKTPQPERIKYPPNEKANNFDNYQSVVSQDNYTSPIFWVPDNKKGTSWYGTYLGRY